MSFSEECKIIFNFLPSKIHFYQKYLLNNKFLASKKKEILLELKIFYTKSFLRTTIINKYKKILFLIKF